MVPVGRLNLLSDHSRLAAAVGGVAFAVALMVIVQGLYQGFRTSVVTFIDELPVQIWVSEAGAVDLFRSTTILPTNMQTSLAAVPGVEGVWPARIRQQAIRGRSSTAESLVMSFDAGAGSGAVARALGLQRLPNTGEIAVSEYVQKHAGIRAGDRVVLNGVPLTVSEKIGIPSPPFGSFSIINYQDAGRIFQMQDTASFFLVSTKDSTNAASVSNTIKNQFQQTSAFTTSEFERTNAKQVRQFLPVVTVLLAVSYLVGLIVASLTIYTATVEKSRDYGVLKAIGASNKYVYGIVIYQSLVVTVLGFLIGTPLAILMSRLARHVAVEFITSYNLTGFLMAFTAVLVMSIIAALLPSRRIGSIDPAIVFRS